MKPMPLYWILTFALPLAAQNAAGPALGLTASADGRSVRLIQGVPGASRYGDAAALPDDLRLLRLSPAASAGIALATDTGLPMLYDIASGTRTVLDGARQSPAGATWSPLGTAFALSYPADAWVQVFTLGDGGSARLNDEFALDGPLAVSDDGGAVLLASGGGLALRTTGGVDTLSDGPVKAFTFLAGTRTPAYATAAGLIIGSALAAGPVDGDETLYLASPARERLVALRASGAATIFDAGGQALAADTCGAPAAGLDSLGRAGSLVLATASPDRAPLCVADASASPRIYFIPPPRENAGADQ